MVRTPAELARDFASCVAAFENEFDYVYNALRRHGVSEADVEDLVQEVFLVMWRRWSQYDQERPIRPWLAGIAFRVSYNHRQRVGREVPGGLIDREDETPDPEERLASDTARSLVRRVLDSLPEKHRALILSHDVEGTSVREIAERLDVPIPTAHTRLRAARKAFAKTWKRLLAVSATRARIAPLLLRASQAGVPVNTAEADAEPEVGRRRKRRAVARARAAFPLLPLAPINGGDGLTPLTVTTPLRREARPPAGLWKAWLPLAGSVVVGGAALFSTILSARVSAKPVEAAVAQPVEVAPRPDRLRTPTFVSTFTSGRLGSPRLSPAAPAFENATTRSDAMGGLAQGLIGYWRFDDGAGSPAARDFSGNGNDCYLRRLDPNLAWGEGRLGGGITFGGQGWLECPHIEPLARLDRQMTLALWVRRSPEKSSVRALVTRQYAQGQLDTIHFGFRNDALALRSRVKGGPVFTPFPRAPAGWHHVTATLDVTGIARLYVDGELVRTKRKEGRPSLGGGTNPLIIGGGVNGPDPEVVSELFHGTLDELVVYDRPLRPDEVRALAQGAQPALSR